MDRPVLGNKVFEDKNDIHVIFFSYRKTFTMGSGVEYNDPSKEGILPRAIMHIFQRCASYEREAEVKGIAISKCVVSCQFIEVRR